MFVITLEILSSPDQYIIDEDCLQVSGASAGSMAALALLADLPLGDMTSQVLKIATEARKCTLGPFSPSFNINQILLDGLQNILPDNVHEKVNKPG